MELIRLTYTYREDNAAHVYTRAGAYRGEVYETGNGGNTAWVYCPNPHAPEALRRFHHGATQEAALAAAGLRS